MELIPSEQTMRLVRARTRLVGTYRQTRAIVAIDVVRWERLAGSLAAALYDPMLDTAELEVEDLHAEEALRLSENAIAAMSRLHRHLSEWDA